jgi:hypothetical protein
MPLALGTPDGAVVVIEPIVGVRDEGHGNVTMVVRINGFEINDDGSLVSKNVMRDGRGEVVSEINVP